MVKYKYDKVKREKVEKVEKVENVVVFGKTSKTRVYMK